MQFVVYVKNGKFILADMDEWKDMTSRYRLPYEKTAKVVSKDMSWFNAMQGQNGFSRQGQAELRELYNGN